MDELTPSSPAPFVPPAPDHPEGAHAPSPRRLKRRLIAWLLGLHVAALLAAAGLVLRARSTGGPKAAGGDKAKALLALNPKDTVGWVSIRGPIFASESGRPWEHGAEQWTRRIEQLAETKGVRAIVLDINSPGGSVGAVQEMHSRILRLKKEHHIPFVALFGDVAASGGYYIAAACDKIVAHPGTLTGSIGVIFEVTNLQGLFQKIGFKMDPIKSGKHKDIGSPGRAMTPEERQIMQALIDDAYGQFVQAVAEGRKIGLDEVKRLADGRIYSGRQAAALNLVDQIGDSKDALKLAAQLGGIKDEEPRVRRDVERFNDFLDLLETRARLTLGVGPVSVPLPTELTAQSHGMLYLWPGW